jgi:hypothetical protein
MTATLATLDLIQNSVISTGRTQCTDLSSLRRELTRTYVSYLGHRPWLMTQEERENDTAYPHGRRVYGAFPQL